MNEELTLEQIRINDFTERFDNLSDLRQCMVLAGYNIPNSKKKRFEAIRDNDLVYLVSLEAVSEQVQANMDEVTASEEAKLLRKANFKANKNPTLPELIEIVKDML